MSGNKVKGIAYKGLLSAFAVILGYVESLIPIAPGIPGVKPGLANFIILIALYEFGIKESFTINLIRILINGMMFGNAFSILFSLAGAFLSLIVMILVKKIKGISIIGVSIAGGVSHNAAQMVIAALVVDTYSIIYYTPVLIISGIITGMLVGILAFNIRPVVSKVKNQDKR